VQHFPPLRHFQIQGDRALAGIQRREGIRPGLALRCQLAQAFAVRWLDLDHVGAGAGQHHRGIRALIELGEIQEREATQRRGGGHGNLSMI